MLTCTLVEGVFVEVETPFAIDAKYLAPSGGEHIDARLVSSSGTIFPVEITDNRNGTYDGTYCSLEQGTRATY